MGEEERRKERKKNRSLSQWAENRGAGRSQETQLLSTLPPWLHPPIRADEVDLLIVCTYVSEGDTQPSIPKSASGHQPLHSKARASILPAGLSALAQQSVLQPLSPRPASLLLSGLPKQSSKCLLRTHNACPAHCSHCFCSLPTQLLPDWGFCRAIFSAGSFWLLSLICRRLPWLPLFHGLTPIVLFFLYCSRQGFL